MLFSWQSTSSRYLSLGRTTIPPPLPVGLITLSLHLHKLSSVDCCPGVMFLYLPECFVFSMIPLVMSFRYMPSSDCSASSVREQGGTRGYVWCLESCRSSLRCVL